jgi:lipoprotein-releasing system ATP-binding protein
MSEAAAGATVAPPAVEAVDVRRDFDGADGRVIRVLRGLNLTLDPGETVAVVGPSGSGKSTLLHILGGLDLPTAGRIALGGRDLANLDDLQLARVRNRYVGFVFQFHHLLRDFTALENVMMPQLIARATRSSARRRAMELLDQVGLADRSGHVPSKLSGGEQQRVATARALANEPPVLLADEPSGNLDLETSELLHDVLFDLVRDHGTAMVVVTHNAALARRTDRILRLSSGVLELDGADTGQRDREN